MIDAHGEMESIAGAQTQNVLIREMAGCAEVKARHGEDKKGIAAKPREHSQSLGAMDSLDVPCAQLHGKRSRELRDYPIADCEAATLLLGQPCLHPRGFRFLGQRGNEQRCIQVERQ